METTPQKYQAYVRQKQKKSPLAKDMALAFLIGGLICVLGQLILDTYTAAGLHQEDAATATSVTLVFLSALFTGLNLYHRLARYGGAPVPWCPSPASPMLWSPRPLTSRQRALSPAWQRKCFWWRGR